MGNVSRETCDSLCKVYFCATMHKNTPEKRLPMSLYDCMDLLNERLVLVNKELSSAEQRLFFMRPTVDYINLLKKEKVDIAVLKQMLSSVINTKNYSKFSRACRQLTG